MRITGKGLISVVAATALACSLSVPAFAAVTDTDGTGNYEGTLGTNGTFDAVTTINADVTAPDAKVISVTVPSTLALPVATKADGGKTVLDAAKTPTQAVQVTNNAQSTTAIKVEVSSVAETPDATNGLYLSSMVDVMLAGPDKLDGIALSKDGAYTATDVLASKIAAGADASLSLTAAEKAAGTEVKAGNYTLKATLKVSPVD